MRRISQDEAERKCANLRLESLHRHNDHEVFLITVIVTPLSKFYLFICCHFHCHRYRNHQGHRQSYLHCLRGQVLLGKLQAVVESHSKCLKNSEKVGDVTSFGKQPTSCSAHHIVHETTTTFHHHHQESHYMNIDHLYLQVFEDHQDSIHNIAAFANKKFEAFEEFSGQVCANIRSRTDSN